MLKLAVQGGQKIRTADFHSWPVFDEKEEQAVLKVLRSGKWWRYSFGEGIDCHESDSGNVSEVVCFQKEFAAAHGSAYGIGCVNGTAALDMIVRALDIGPGDEVIVPAYTYVTGTTCVLWSNAVPIFVDIDKDTYTIDPDKIEESITERTKAIIPCHFGGQTADMDRILAIAEKYKLLVIEDAAHAHGAEWRGKAAGSLGNAAAFSFQISKNMTAGEGGIALTADAELAERIECLTWSGRKYGKPWYEFYQLGWNYRMMELQAAILRIQLMRLPEQSRRRRENAIYLSQLLNEIGGVDPAKIDPRAAKNSVHIFILRYDPEEFKGLSRGKLLEAVNAEGIPAFSGYTHTLYNNPMYREKAFYKNGCPIACAYYNKNIDYRSFAESCPVSERAAKYETVWLEQRLFLGSKRDMDDIAAAFSKVKKGVDQLL